MHPDTILLCQPEDIKMAVWTKGLITQNISVEDIADVLKNQYGATEIRIEDRSFNKDFFTIIFKEQDGLNVRNMSVFENSLTKSDNVDIWKGDQTFIMLGDSGDSRKIIRTVLETFGGYLKECDVSDDEQWKIIDPINVLTAEELEDRRIQRAVLAGVSAVLESLKKDRIATEDPDFIEHLTLSVSDGIKKTFGKTETNHFGI